LRIAFAGTPEFARAALMALHAVGHDLALVLTQPDRPGGRGMKLQLSAVKQFALDQGLALAQPRSLRLDGKYPDDAAAARQALLAAQPDVLVVAAYGLILPQWVLDLPRHGCLNIHGSLLPRWRGAAPIHRAIEAGDSETGITLMQMDAGLDTGDMLAVQRLPILVSDTTGSLHDRLAAMGAQMVVAALAQLDRGDALTATPQPEAGVTYAHKIEKHEALVDWTQPAELIARRVRAFNPFPGAATRLEGETVKIWAASALPEVAGAPCGTVLCADAQGIVVATAAGALCIQQLQRPGGKRLGAADFLRGFALPPGTQLGSS
jgi:methionyl-tRNA formyltransferase